MTRTRPSACLSRRRLLLAAALFGGATVALTSHATPPPWAPAHGRRAKPAQEYRYVYYPRQQVYYAPNSGQWFWLSDGNWQFGISLPAQYSGYASSGGVSVVLHSSRPYVEHGYVEREYGRPWRQKHKQPKKEKHGHDDRRHDQDHGRHDHRD